MYGRVQIQDQGWLPKYINSSFQARSWMTSGNPSLYDLHLPWGNTEPCVGVPAPGNLGSDKRLSQDGPCQSSVLQALPGEIQGDLLEVQSLH